ncbi:hypothetical protein SD77_3964 [Bacillus badius]|uniref:Uncharacterized protein n=1 Tax=Bacillus badius TaxID=1455 RepID=A0ABR5AU96_BACBA|nr:hypothetical protein SD77_3964 [Bacillus badius]
MILLFYHISVRKLFILSFEAENGSSYCKQAVAKTNDPISCNI